MAAVGVSAVMEGIAMLSRVGCESVLGLDRGAGASHRLKATTWQPSPSPDSVPEDRRSHGLPVI
jgi:hypothetical protein